MSPDPHGRPSVHERNRFLIENQPRWQALNAALSDDSPPDWDGFVFTARVDRDPITRAFSLKCEFQDSASNRRGSVGRGVLARVTELQELQFAFSPIDTWTSMTIRRMRDAGTGEWVFETGYAYSR